jgi:hypothetical protein
VPPNSVVKWVEATRTISPARPRWTASAATGRCSASGRAVAIWSLMVIALALRSALPATETAEIMVEMGKTA